MEQEVIADIARRVKKTGRYTETAELMAKSMVEQGYSAAKIQADVMKFLRADKEYQKAVAENTKAYKQEIQDIIDETVKTAKEAGNKLVAEAGSMAWNNDLSMWEEHGVDLTEPNDMTQLLESFKKQTNGQLRNITKTTGFRNTVLGTTGVMQAYQREMDLATMKIASGTFSYDEAVNECVKRLAQSGLRSIDYASGRTYQLDTAARMCVRTGMSQLSGKITEMNLKNTGQDLVRTSQHMGSRSEHAPWQNKVFSYSGTSKKYPDFFLETGYGTVEGLKGANCTHDFYPYWEGDYIPPDVEPNEEYYNNTQKQRAMERGIRATKREIEAQKAIGGDTTELRAKLKKQTADYYSFSDKVGIRPKDNRLNVIAGTSKLNNTNVFKDGAKYGIIKENKLYRARKINNEKDLEKVSKSKVISFETYEEIQQHFKDNYNIDVVGFEKKELFSVKATLAGYDDILSEFPNAKLKLNSIQYNPNSKHYGTLNNKGVSQVGPNGLKDYGTGVHETTHAYDWFMSKPNTHSFAEEVVEQARKNLKLRKNSKEYINLAYQITGSLEDMKKPYELLAYGIETAKGGINNKLAIEIYRIMRNRNESL